MKNTAISMLVAATAIVAFSSARAQDANANMYAELGYTHLSAKALYSGNALKTSPSAVSAVVGYQVTPVMAVEALLGLGLGKNELKENGVGTGVDGKLENMVGLFVRPSVTLGDGVTLFARAGIVRTSVELSDGWGSRRGTGLAYGLGANIHLAKTSYIQVSAMNYYSRNSFKVNGITVGYGMRF